ncbi:Uncharacterised protein [Mycobacteroides abscessus subsp. bolletii]|nr:Uncharacterised protein [Mycobacteroides abscessus subsp. bolletii]SHR82446.1 Uncharacterised protein [Mycobacteroides abscessus subsp. bolletii]SHS56839.1 Uncharacterised protein [Mycobacteroides abscessus subsp. bolletii]SHY26511.1 Uncharacterised protein [Mycobacteroides abscessus subsp. bolletii]SHY35700.1 Uncharacterised protein [Mycobacteroides abscessus subsp. bolletii]
MTCQSRSVPTTPTSATPLVSSAARSGRPRRFRRSLRRCHFIGRPFRSSTARAPIASATELSPRTRAANLSEVGSQIKRVSMTTCADNPGVSATFKSVKSPVTWGLYSTGRVPVAPGIPTKVALAPPALAHISKELQAPDSTAARGAVAAALSRKATITRSEVARTNNACLLALKPPSGIVDRTTPPSLGSVAIARHGMCASKDNGAPATSGAVIPAMFPSAVAPWGQLTRAVDCRTGSNGTSPHNSNPKPAMTSAIRPARRAVVDFNGAGVDDDTAAILRDNALVG